LNTLESFSSSEQNYFINIFHLLSSQRTHSAMIQALVLETIVPVINRVETADNESDGYSSTPSLSANGRFVAFSSSASNWVEGDTNNNNDIFVYDRRLGVTERVSVSNSGGENRSPSYNPSLSADGRYVAFQSSTTDLIEGVPVGSSGIFVYDRDANTVELVSGDRNNPSTSTSATGIAGNAKISADGRYVAFKSSANNLVEGDTNNKTDVFVHDRELKVTERVSVGSRDEGSIDLIQSNQDSDQPMISADGRFVAFTSSASNLVENDTNNTSDIFVYDRQSDTVERVSLSSSGEQGNGFANAPSISADGRYVSFSSAASNLVEGDTNRVGDVFVYDRTTQVSERVSVDSVGAQSNGFSFNHGLSADGRYASYSTVASNLLGRSSLRNRDVFVYDRESKTSERVSLSHDGIAGNGDSRESVLSADGRFVAFQSSASNLLADDTNARTDIFVLDRNPLAENPLPDVVLPDAVLPDSSNRPLGAQGQSAERKFVDLKAAQMPTVTASIEVIRDAGYNNTVGFYKVEDDRGSVKDLLTGEWLSPGDSGYVQAAITQRIDLSLTGESGESTAYSAQLKSGTVLSTFIVSNGTIESLLDTETLGDPAVFFGNMGANSDRQEHVRLIGDNTFGYEDVVGGGDQDFDDMIVKMSFN
jgi:Tol biopolymer transport system component